MIRQLKIDEFYDEGKRRRKKNGNRINKALGKKN